MIPENGLKIWLKSKLVFLYMKIQHSKFPI